MDYFEFSKSVLCFLPRYFAHSDFVKAWFFIRYIDWGPHARIRFRIDDFVNFEFVERDIFVFLAENCPGLSFTFLKNQFDSLNKSLVFVDYVDYVPELERYGGIKGIGVSERQFEISSNFIISQIDSKKRWNYEDSLLCAIKMHLVFLRVFEMGKNDAIAFFRLVYSWWSGSAKYSLGIHNIDDSDSVLEELFSKVYSNQRDGIASLIESFYYSLNFSNKVAFPFTSYFNDFIFVKNELFDLDRAGQLYYDSTFSIYGDCNFSNSFYLNHLGLLQSYFHMTNNRLGIQNHDEAFLGYVLYRGLADI